MKIVLADSSIVTASSKEHPDLFWALRGAGQANFGVVTEYKYKLYPVQPDILEVTGPLTRDDAAQIFTTLGREERKLPVNCNMAGLSHADGMSLSFVCLGATKMDLYDGQVTISNLLHESLSKQAAKRYVYKRASWIETALAGSVPSAGVLRQAWSGFLMQEDNDYQTWEKILDAFWEMCRDNTHIRLAVDLRGGAMSRVDPSATAFPWRKALYSVRAAVYVSMEDHDADSIYQRQVERVGILWDARIAPHLRGAIPGFGTNSLGALPPMKVAEMAWEGNLHRLEQVKDQYDPDNVFQSQLIVPLSK